jgi:hypothetical protein
MRPISQDVYGIPRQRVIGSSAALAYTSDEHGGRITHKASADYTGGAEHALERAVSDGWTVISVKNDWATVF